MSGTIAAQNTEEIAELATQISSYTRSITYWQGQEGAADSRAFDLRRVKQGLTNGISPLAGIFTPIRTYHTVNTWEGNAATASRERLDIHEEVLGGARRNIEALIDDLQDELVITEGEADWAGNRVSHYRSLRWAAEEEKRDLQRLY